VAAIGDCHWVIVAHGTAVFTPGSGNPPKSAPWSDRLHASAIGWDLRKARALRHPPFYTQLSGDTLTESLSHGRKRYVLYDEFKESHFCWQSVGIWAQRHWFPCNRHPMNETKSVLHREYAEHVSPDMAFVDPT
jgi:hypothetical protein